MLVTFYTFAACAGFVQSTQINFASDPYLSIESYCANTRNGFIPQSISTIFREAVLLTAKASLYSCKSKFLTPESTLLPFFRLATGAADVCCVRLLPEFDPGDGQLLFSGD